MGAPERRRLATSSTLKFKPANMDALPLYDRYEIMRHWVTTGVTSLVATSKVKQ